MLGWGADFPDATNFFDFHFGVGASPQFGTGFPEMHDVLSEAGSTPDEATRIDLYAQANELLFQHAQAIPIAYGGSALAYKADVTTPTPARSATSRWRSWASTGRTSSCSCRTASRRASTAPTRPTARPCGSASRSVSRCWPTRSGGTESVPSLATEWESNDDLTEWTFTLRPDVTFHDGSTFDANDVVQSYRIQWDAADPAHVGPRGHVHVLGRAVRRLPQPAARGRWLSRYPMIGWGTRPASPPGRADDVPLHPSSDRYDDPGAHRHRHRRVRPGPGDPGRPVHGDVRREGDARRSAPSSTPATGSTTRSSCSSSTTWATCCAATSVSR